MFAEAGRDRPRVAVLAIHHDEHTLLRLVDGHDDLGAGGDRRKQGHSKHRGRSHGRHSNSSTSQPPSHD